MERVAVLVRVRPSELDRLPSDPACVLVEGNEVVLSHRGKQVRGVFDHVLGEDASQEHVFAVVDQCTGAAVLGGVSATVLAYGQTGSGKTHTMFGSTDSHLANPHLGNPHLATPQLEGVIPRAIRGIFRRATEERLDVRVTCSFAQAYNECLYDTLRDPGMHRPLSIRENAEGGVYLQGASEYPVRSVGEAMALLFLAEEGRSTRATAMNVVSSRSHSVFTISVERRVEGEGGLTLLSSKYCLVDLAGSERTSVEGGTAEHRAELAHINLSLHTLGRCIAALASAQPHVPYRDSKLTRLLQHSLGGRTLTLLIATINPHLACAEDSRRTLALAAQAGHVLVSAPVNVTHPLDRRYVAALLSEMAALKKELAARGRDVMFGGSGGRDATCGGSEEMGTQTSDLSSTQEHAVEDPEGQITGHTEGQITSRTEGHTVEGMVEFASVLTQTEPSPTSDARPLPPPPEPTSEQLSLASDLAMEEVRQLWGAMQTVRSTLNSFRTYEMEEEEMLKRLDKVLRDMPGSCPSLRLQSPRHIRAPPPPSSLSPPSSDRPSHHSLHRATPHRRVLSPLSSSHSAGHVRHTRSESTSVLTSSESAALDCEGGNNFDEARLLREVRKTEERLGKARRLHEWRREREDRARVAATLQQSEIEAIRVAAGARELQRTERAAALRSRVAEHRNRARSEARLVLGLADDDSLS